MGLRLVFDIYDYIRGRSDTATLRGARHFLER